MPAETILELVRRGRLVDTGRQVRHYTRCTSNDCRRMIQPGTGGVWKLDGSPRLYCRTCHLTLNANRP